MFGVPKALQNACWIDTAVASSVNHRSLSGPDALRTAPSCAAISATACG
jgi:hypothetical protein